MATREKYGTQTSKGVVIYAFRNGDKHHTGEKLVLHPTKQRTFEQVLQAMSTSVKLPTGNVRRVLTITGKPIKEISEFKDGGKYICCGAEKLNREQMPFVLQEILVTMREKAKAKAEKQEGATNEEENEQENEENEHEDEPEQQETHEEKREAPSSAVEKEIEETTQKLEKYGIQTDKGKIIRVYRNGDKHHEGDRYVVHAKKYKTVEQLQTDISLKTGVATGPVKKLLYLHESSNPTIIRSLDDIKDKTCILACGAEAPKQDLVHPSYFERTKVAAAKGAAGATATGASPVKKAVASTDTEKFGTENTKRKVIQVFRNGDKYDAGTRMVILPKKYKNMNQVYDEMNTKVGVVTGSVRKVYCPSGAVVSNVDDFEDGEAYICAGGEALKKDLFSAALLKFVKA